jgi:hypothetical protein
VWSARRIAAVVYLFSRPEVWFIAHLYSWRYIELSDHIHAAMNFPQGNNPKFLLKGRLCGLLSLDKAFNGEISPLNRTPAIQSVVTLFFFPLIPFYLQSVLVHSANSVNNI